MVIDLSANGATVDPPRLQVQESGVGGFAYAVVSLPNHESTGIVRALSDFGEQAYSVTSAPQANSLELEPSLTNIVGFGIGTSTIAVVLRAEDGMEFRPLQVGSISLTTSGGRLDQADLSFPPNSGRASTMIRSAFLGTANIGAKIDNLTAPAVTVTFTTPWSILVAVVLGAALGAFVRARSNQQGLTSSQFATGAGAGVILAMGSFVGLTMVVNLPETALVTEAGCFVIGALEAYLGRMALDRVVPGASTA